MKEMTKRINEFFANHVEFINGRYYFATHQRNGGWYGPLRSEIAIKSGCSMWSAPSLNGIPGAGGIYWNSYEAFRAWARKAYKNGNL